MVPGELWTSFSTKSIPIQYRGQQLSKGPKVRDEVVGSLQGVKELGTALAAQDVRGQLLGFCFGQLSQGQAFQVARVGAGKRFHPGAS